MDDPGPALPDTTSPPDPSHTEPDLYRAIGGADLLATAVTVLYRRVLADPELAGWFDGVDVRRLRTHQRAFLTAAMGGPNLFAGRNLTTAHRGLAITDAAFDALAEHLACTLRDLGVSPDAVARVDEHIQSHRSEVVGTNPE